jgi:FMN phosphatase YigB (HAD superfamily)
MNIRAILFDLGDVIMQEETEVRDEEGNTRRAELVDGMGELLHALKSRGYPFGLVADTRSQTAWNVLHQHHLYDLFDAFAISESVGCEKPDARIFRAALDALGIVPDDYPRVLMIGNNLMRDVRGANQLGLVSVWFHWNDRYLPDPDFVDTPAYEARNAGELLEVIERIEENESAKRKT